MWSTGPSSAQACSFKNTNAGEPPPGLVIAYLRCVSREVNELRRENRDLRDRIEKLEEIATELPAVYENANGEITEEPGRAIGRASFTLSARSTGGANFLALEQRVLEELCDKSGGCQMSLAFREFSLFGNEPKNPKISGPCLFQYTADSGEWVRGDGCGDGGSLSGIDGDQRAALDAQGSEIAEASGACLLAESGTSRDIEDAVGFERDHAKGLFLVSVPSRQPDGIRRFECELVLD